MAGKIRSSIRLSTVLALGVTAVSSADASVASRPSNQSRPSVQLGGRPLQQVAMTTANLERAITFYLHTLGLPLTFTANNMAFFDIAGVRLMIALDEDRPGRRATTILYFDAPDFDTTVGRLRAAGVSLQGPVETVQRTVAGELKLQQFTDPDGNMLAVTGLVSET